MRLVQLTARAMIAWVFVSGGAATLRDPAPRASAAAGLLGHLRQRVPFLPDDLTLVQVNAAAQVLGGAALLLGGPGERHAARTLAASLIPTTLAGHPFWAAPDPGTRAAEAIAFGKNLGILGGLLLLSGHASAWPRRGPGRGGA